MSKEYKDIKIGDKIKVIDPEANSFGQILTVDELPVAFYGEENECVAVYTKPDNAYFGVFFKGEYEVLEND